MTVDKMELLKRYKELKAQGVNITLMELKKQMDGVNEVSTQNYCHSELYKAKQRGYELTESVCRADSES